MAGTVEPWVAAVGAVPGVIGLLGAAAAFWRTGVRAGRIEQRLAEVESDVASMKDLGKDVATINERTKNTDDNMKAMRDDVGRITGALLQDRSFAPEARPRRSR